MEDTLLTVTAALAALGAAFDGAARALDALTPRFPRCAPWAARAHRAVAWIGGVPFLPPPRR